MKEGQPKNIIDLTKILNQERKAQRERIKRENLIAIGDWILPYFSVEPATKGQHQKIYRLRANAPKELLEIIEKPNNGKLFSFFSDHDIVTLARIILHNNYAEELGITLPHRTHLNY